MDHYQNENIFHGSTAFHGQVDLGGFIEVLGQRGIVPAIVADEMDRANYLDMWMEEKNVVPSLTHPCIVFRENGSSTGLLEICVDPAGEVWSPLTDPPGTLKETMSSVAPYGWYLCEGQLLTPSHSGHAPLFANCPTLREGSNIRLPDMRARTTVGAGPRLTSGKPARGLGDTGGLEEVTLSKGQTPLVDHLHEGFNWDTRIKAWMDVAYVSLGSEVGSVMSGTGRTYPTLAGAVDRSRDIILVSHPGSTASPVVTLPEHLGLGSGSVFAPTQVAGRDAQAAHENMPPFVAVSYLIKA